MAQEIDDVGELRRLLAAAKESQSGSDREVGRLRDELERLQGELESARTTKARQEQVDQLQLEKERFQRQREVWRLAQENGVDPQVALTAFGLGDDGDADDEDRVGALAEYVKAERASGELERAKANARKPGTGAKLPEFNLDDLAALGKNGALEFARAHPDEFDRLTGRSGSRPTLRDRIRNLGGL